jgi:hypothetical protein
MFCFQSLSLHLKCMKSMNSSKSEHPQFSHNGFIVRYITSVILIVFCHGRKFLLLTGFLQHYFKFCCFSGTGK